MSGHGVENDPAFRETYYGKNDPKIRQPQKDVKRASTTRSPIILDLDGDGITTTSIAAGAFFDHAGDGFAERTGWVGPKDAVLARDLDADGQIASGKELFGDSTVLRNGARAANGFEALAEVDENHDGRVDAQDSGFSGLLLPNGARGLMQLVPATAKRSG
jgi:hypothetical protein